MNHLTVEKLNAKNIDAASALMTAACADVHGFEPLPTEDVAMFGFMCRRDGKPISLAYATMEDGGKERIRWAYAHPDFRGECHSLSPMRACVDHLKRNGAGQIRVDNWVDSPYRQMLSQFESEGIGFKHDQLVLRLDMSGHAPNPPAVKSGYSVRPFRDGDEVTWADVKNAVFGSQSPPEEFWNQGFLGVDMPGDFDAPGFFFAEKDGEAVGICAGIVLHQRRKIGGTFPGGIGWTGVCEAHRGNGLGRALMVSSLNYLHERGIAFTEVGTQFYRTEAVTLYESLGFRIHFASFDLC